MARNSIRAKELMKTVRVTLQEDEILRVALNSFVYNKLQILPVLKKDGRLAGILTTEDILEKITENVDMENPVSKYVNINNTVCVTSNTMISANDFIAGTVCVCDDGQFKGIIDKNAIINYYKWTARLLDKFETKCHDYEILFNNCYDSIYYVDKDGIVIMANPATSRLSGLTPDQVIGRNVKDIEFEKVFFPSVVNIVLQKKEITTILQNAKEGTIAVATGVPVFDEKHNLERVIAISRDVNELVQQLENFSKTKEMRRIIDKLQANEALAKKYFAELRQLRKENKVELKIRTKNRDMEVVSNLVKRVATVDSNVLILGESGVGKDMIANIIHNMSTRSSGPYVSINCGAIPAGILESELFGYEPGAFTGALKTGKIGLMEIANSGTVFLNEIGEIPLNLQVKLLQVIQERSFIRVGGTEVKKVDFRIISATNKDLKEMVRLGTFREDLFYRLNVVPIVIPPLRNRKEDLPELILEFVESFNKKYNRNKQLASETMKILLNYDWPGNVRELENLIERIIIISREDTIFPYDLPPEFGDLLKRKQTGKYVFDESISLQEAVENTEMEILKATYEKYRSTIKLADILQVNQSTIARKLKKYNIDTGKN